MSIQMDEKTRWQYQWMEKLDTKLDEQIQLLKGISTSMTFFVILTILVVIIQGFSAILAIMSISTIANTLK